MSNSKPWFCICLLITLTNSACAATVFWQGGAPDNLWNTAENWDGGVVPGPGDTADNSVSGSTTRLEGMADVDTVHFGFDGDSNLEIDGGTLNVAQHIQLGFFFHANFRMLSGTVNIGNFLTVSERPSSGGSAHVQVDGGTISTNNFAIKENASIDMTGGSLTYRNIWPGSVFADINDLISNDVITAFGGTGFVRVTANEDGTTTLMPLEELPEYHEWLQTGVGAWSAPGNWLASSLGPGPPNDNTRIALFGSSITSPQTVSVNTDVTVKEIRLQNTNTYAIAGPGSVTLEADSGNAAIHVMEGSHELQVRVNLASETDVTADAGTHLDFNNELTLNGNNLNLSGDGPININHMVNSGGGTVNNSGTLGGAGINTISGDLNSTGALHIDLGGKLANQFDSFTIGGTATLSGLLDTELINGFTPASGDTFTVVTAASITDNGLALTPEAAALFTMDVGSTSVVLSAIGGGAATGDYNGDGIVNAADYTIFRDQLGSNNALPNDNGLGVPISSAHYALWRNNFGTGGTGSGSVAVPEPASVLMVAVALVGIMTSNRRKES